MCTRRMQRIQRRGGRARPLCLRALTHGGLDQQVLANWAFQIVRLKHRGWPTVDSRCRSAAARKAPPLTARWQPLDRSLSASQSAALQPGVPWVRAGCLGSAWKCKSQSERAQSEGCTTDAMPALGCRPSAVAKRPMRETARAGAQMSCWEPVNQRSRRNGRPRPRPFISGCWRAFPTLLPAYGPPHAPPAGMAAPTEPDETEARFRAMISSPLLLQQPLEVRCAWDDLSGSWAAANSRSGPPN